MRHAWKVALGLLIALMLPVAAYAAGSLTAPNDAPAPRRDIVIEDPSARTNESDGPARLSKAEREARDRRRDRQDQKRDARDDRGDVKVVTPQPTPVNEDDDGDDDDDEWED